MVADDCVFSLLSQVARLPPNRIRIDARLGDLGLGSSIALNMLQSRLTEEFGVSPQMSWKTSVQEVVAAVNAGAGARLAVATPPAAATAASVARSLSPLSPAAGAPSIGSVHIVGIGIDLEDPSSLPEMGDPFYGAHFTAREIEHARDVANAREHLAGIWSAKEAAKKAVAELMDVPFTSLEVRHDDRGRPSLVVSAPGVDARLRFHVSITHTKNMAAAVVVAVMGS
jgi:phosphopantetheine--protein transferase-like protein